jgi:CheY-like chemotaxis protein
MKLDMRRIAVGATTSLLLVSAALACGDKLVALGGGVPFDRIGKQRYPGSVILFANPERRLNSAITDIRLDSALTRAGHTVRTVVSRADLERALNDAKIDIVLMDLADAVELNARLTDKVPTLPVLYGARADELPAAATDRCVLDTDKRRAMKLIKAVNQIIEGHEKGQPVLCAQIGGRGLS